MSLELWANNAWLREHKTSVQEVTNLLFLVERDLSDSAMLEISLDWRFNIVYNAGLQLATVVLYASGYRSGRGESKHYRVIQTIPHVLGYEFRAIRDYLDSCRRKRNISEYDAVGTISEKEVKDLTNIVKDFKAKVEKWLSLNHPDLIK